MTFRHEHTILALVVVFFAAACGSHEDSDENAQSSDAGPDAAADSGDGDPKPTAGRGGSGGRGGSTASGQSGAGGSSGRGGAPAAAGAGGSGGAGGAAGRSGRAGRGGSSGEGGKGGAPAEAGKGGAAAAGKGGAPAAGAPAAGAPAAGAPAAGAPAAGAPAAGTGGVPAAGAGGTGGTAGAPVDDDDAGVPEVPPPGPFYSSGTIKGHFWISQSGVGTTLTTTGYENVPVATAPVCIQGSVVATPDYNSNANLGINLNQLMNMIPAPFTPTLAGIQLQVTNRATSPLRIQIQTADGSANWCAIVNGAGGFIPWADFNTACWDGSGTAYARQPIQTANLQIPGGTTAAIPYDVCLNSLTESAAPVGPPPPPVAGAPAPPPPPAAGAPAPPPPG